jgi:hypothetical protein
MSLSHNLRRLDDQITLYVVEDDCFYLFQSPDISCLYCIHGAFLDHIFIAPPRPVNPTFNMCYSPVILLVG